MHTYVIREQSASECVEGHRGLRGSHARNRGLKLFARTIPPRVTDHMLRAAPRRYTRARAPTCTTSLLCSSSTFSPNSQPSSFFSITRVPLILLLFYPSAVTKVFLFIRDSTDESLFPEISCARWLSVLFRFVIVLTRNVVKLKVNVVVKDRRKISISAESKGIVTSVKRDWKDVRAQSFPEIRIYVVHVLLHVCTIWFVNRISIFQR